MRGEERENRIELILELRVGLSFLISKLCLPPAVTFS